MDPDYLENFDVLLSTTDALPASFTTTLESAVTPGATAYEQKSYDLTAYAGQTVYIAIHITTTDMFRLLLDDFEFGTTDAHDLSVSAITPSFCLLGAPTTPVVTIKNLGASSEASYSVQLTDGASYTQTIPVTTAIAPGATYNVTFPSWTATAAGVNKLTATVTVTGDAVVANNALSALDILNPNNITYAYSIYNEGSLPQKTPVIFDLSTPENIYSIADHSADTYSVWGGEWVNNVWYAYDNQTTPSDKRFITINPTTGTKTVIAAGLTIALADLTYDYSTQTMYGIATLSTTTYGLYSVNLTTGVSTQIGTTGIYGF